MPAHCPTQDELKAFSLGNLAGRAFEQVATHVVDCTVCDTKLRALDDHSDDLIAELRQLNCETAGNSPTAATVLDVAETAAKRFLESDSGEIAVDPGRRFARLVANGPCRLGRFQLESQLGVGSFGYVFRAHDTELDRTVAIKIQRAGSLSGQEELDRFLREARSVAHLKNPGIVSLYEAAH